MIPASIPALVSGPLAGLACRVPRTWRGLAVGCLASAAVQAAEITVFAAASLSDALKEVAPLYTRASGHSVHFNLGGSGGLARQIREGAPADVFFSADEFRMEQLQREGQLLKGTRRNVVANTLVLVAPADGTLSVTSLAELDAPAIRRLATGEPATVPAGAYAKAHLEKRGLWGRLSAKILPLDNVRAVLATVEAGNADVGLVYRTDALISKKVRVLLEIPADEEPAIVYPVAIVKASKHAQVARGFVAFLVSDEARAIFARHGFLPLKREREAPQ